MFDLFCSNLKILERLELYCIVLYYIVSLLDQAQLTYLVNDRNTLFFPYENVLLLKKNYLKSTKNFFS
jgi:hypothetical protein